MSKPTSRQKSDLESRLQSIGLLVVSVVLLLRETVSLTHKPFKVYLYGKFGSELTKLRIFSL